MSLNLNQGRLRISTTREQSVDGVLIANPSGVRGDWALQEISGCAIHNNEMGVKSPGLLSRS